MSRDKKAGCSRACTYPVECRQAAIKNAFQSRFSGDYIASLAGDNEMQFRSALLAIILTCSAANAEKIELKSLGVSVDRPDDWHDVTPAEYRNNLSRVQTADPAFHELVRKNASTPFFVFTKFPEPHDDLNPSFRISVRALHAPDQFNSIEVMKLTISQLARSFPDIRAEKGPMAAKFGGLDGAYFKASYTVSASGREFPTTAEIWIARRGAEAFIGGASRSAGPNAIGEAELAKIVSSVRIEP